MFSYKSEANPKIAAFTTTTLALNKARVFLQSRGKYICFQKSTRLFVVLEIVGLPCWRGLVVSLLPAEL
jgi:hypothetical protein